MGSSVEDVLARANARRDKEIRWLRPEQVVFPALTTRGRHLDLEKPATVDSLRIVVIAAGKLAGILGKITAHDLRNGAVWDATHSKVRATDEPTLAVARSVGHTYKALHTGVTDLYAGSSSHDFYSSRILETPEAPTFGLQTAAAGYKKILRLDTPTVTDSCLEQNLDPSSEINRRQVRAKHKKEQFGLWVKGQSDPSPSASGTVILLSFLSSPLHPSSTETAPIIRHAILSTC